MWAGKAGGSGTYSVFMASAQTNCSEELNPVAGVGNGKGGGMRLTSEAESIGDN